MMREQEPRLILKCKRCKPEKALGQNALVEYGFCVHRRIAIAKPFGWGCWHVLHNATPATFADLVLTICMLNAFEPDFWTRLIAPGSEGLK
jgi:hypothetical protein